MRKYILLITLLLFMITSIYAGEGEGYHLKVEAESWIEKIEFDRKAEIDQEQVKAGVYYLLYDNQIFVDEAVKRDYVHMVVKVINENGLESFSQLSFDYEPSYNKLAIHKVTVHRGDKKIEQLDQKALKIIEESGSQEYLIYDETKSVNLILNDIRVGDIIEYSYTRYGSNPIFKNRFFETFYLGWGFPIEKVNYRVIAPRGRTLNTRSFYSNVEPEIIKRSDNYLEYRVEAEKTGLITSEENAPDWYNPYPRIQFSEFKSWDEVNELFLEHYTISGESKRAIQEEYEKIISSTKKKDYAIKELVDFVRTKIRYLGVEIGESSHKPSLPEEVMERRYGDCKDKTMLLVALLQMLGIEAYPVLVDTEIGHALDRYLPSPGLFNHAIALAIVNGNEYWIDPTITYQRGLLEHSYQYDYGYSLVLKEGSKELKRMIKERTLQPNKETQEIFNLTEGIDKPGSMYVKTTFKGDSADYMREELSYYTKDELQKNYLKYYAESYPSIELAKTFSLDDNEDTNRLIIEEDYNISEIWYFDNDEKVHRADFYPDDLLSYITEPEKSENIKREAPYELNHPVSIRYSTKVLLPEANWGFKDKHGQVDNDYFFFTHSFVYVKQENAVYMVYNYVSKKDYLKSDELDSYRKAIKEVKDNVGYYIYDREKHEKRVKLIIFLLVIAFSVIVAAIILIIDRFKNREKYAMKAKLKRAHKSNDYHHKCRSCGRTDISNPELSFRYCDECSDESCYCSDHISGHSHI